MAIYSYNKIVCRMYYILICINSWHGFGFPFTFKFCVNFWVDAFIKLVIFFGNYFELDGDK